MLLLTMYHIEDSNDEEDFYRYRFQQYLLSGLLVIRKKQVHEMYTLLISHCFIVKLGHTGVHIVFLFLTQNIDCGYSLELPHGVLKCTHNQCFEHKYFKYHKLPTEIFNFN